MDRSDIKVDFVGVEQALAEDGVCATLTNGGSMWPLFKTHRDIIIVEKITQPLKRYDAVLYKVEDKFVLHRIIGYKKETDEYIIRGDNTFVKEYVRADSIIAVLAAFRRKSRYKTVSSISYKAYTRLWLLIYPLRYLVHKLISVLSKAKRILFK